MPLRTLIPLFICTSFCLGGCTTGAWYEGMKRGAENECYKQPPGASQECLERLNKKSYNAYEKERATKMP
jgi:hypothetical protein